LDQFKLYLVPMLYTLLKILKDYLIDSAQEFKSQKSQNNSSYHNCNDSIINSIIHKYHNNH